MTNFIFNKQALHISKRVVARQVFLGVLCIVGAACSRNLHVTISALIGAILVIVPTLSYIKISALNFISPVSNVLSRHKRAELVKFLFSIVGFGGVFAYYKQVDIIVLFAAYVVTLSGYWWGLLE